MKDFAKSIRVGNAYTKGQVLGQEGDKKYVFGGEINGTYIVHRQPDGKTFSFSSEQEIKDWMRNSKIGNKKVGNEYKPDVSKTPAEYERIIKQTQKADDLRDLNDDIDYDIREYDNAIDDCNMRIKDYQRLISALRMVQRDVKDAIIKLSK